MEILANLLEDTWIGFASAAFIILVVVTAHFLRRVARTLFHWKEQNEEASERPWKPDDDFHIEVNKGNEQKK